MIAATHNGTCQACGREQASRPSGLAKHGYTVTWGYFNGTCSGSRHAPLEESRKLLDFTCADMSMAATRLESVTADDVDSIQVQEYDRKGGKRGHGGYVVNIYSEDEWLAKEISEYDRRYGGRGWSDMVKHEVNRLHREAKSYRAHVAMLEKLATERHGQPLIERGPKAPPSDRCPGSGDYPATNDGRLYQPCKVCGTSFKVTHSGTVANHKTPKSKETAR
jgi:hypothetical protein